MKNPDADQVPPFRPSPATSPSPPVKAAAKSDYTLVVVIVAASMFLFVLMLGAGVFFFRGSAVSVPRGGYAPKEAQLKANSAEVLINATQESAIEGVDAALEATAAASDGIIVNELPRRGN